MNFARYDVNEIYERCQENVRVQRDRKSLRRSEHDTKRNSSRDRKRK